MPTPLIIDDPETVAAIERVAAHERKPPQEVVSDLVQRHARSLPVISARTPAEKMAALRKTLARIDALPMISDQPVDDILDYDELGLPR